MGDLPQKRTNPLTNLEMVQLVANTGITRPHTRDEIVCQLFKQLSNNPNRVSHARGWILLGLIFGCFAPSKRLRGVVDDFLTKGPPKYAPFVRARLQRTVNKGTRTKPPTALEVEMAFSKEPIRLQVDFFVDRVNVELDSQTTARELLEQIYAQSALAREAGFSIYVADTDGDMMTSCGAGDTFVLDIVFQYETLASARFQGSWQRLAQERPFQLLLRKEMFAPWFEGGDNADIIFEQIVDGLERANRSAAADMPQLIRFHMYGRDVQGFYTVQSEEDMASMLARLYYIERGFRLEPARLERMIKRHDFAGMERHDLKYWIAKTTERFDYFGFYDNPCTELDCKVEVIHYARTQWAQQFSKQFQECELRMGDRLPEVVTLYLNREGLMAFNFANLTAGAKGAHMESLINVGFEKILEISPVTVVEETINPENRFDVVSISSIDGVTIHAVISSYLQGVINRSKYAMATMAYRAPSSNSSFLSFEVGDLIVMSKPWQQADLDGWATGTDDSTHRRGDFPIANVVPIPVIGRPTKELVAQWREHWKTMGPVIDIDAI
ncbi:uncharacterized protein MONBRDRAFT_32975 [Monosiga brevicollis MX1]|uniref:SH3 domain-containing protein n=1 Tax=Monosiga brevicollis TaxID=81824 RepID=A9V2T9_MONBE|nr:uncharacterized protein MONBRDRAFT_32975 [Monosiga brevicollis MX1]EDQ87942.1 predicted protein [Monosiga brevicollis MX1]|eukprot:XP_001747018.1 hypothetical protein [Monosiga brevicollis MX1]